MAIINIINLTDTYLFNRYEAEFYDPYYLALNDKISSLKHTSLNKLVSRNVMTGHTPSMKNSTYYGGYIKFIKTDNIRNNEITLDFTNYLSESGNDLISRTALEENDILVTIIGATYDVIARSCIVDINVLPANINQNIALIRIDKNKIKPEYIVTYLSCIYGKKSLYWLSRQTGQVNLNCREIGILKIPLFSNEFQVSISNIVNSSRELKLKSDKFSSEAVNKLLNEIGLFKWKCIRKKSFIKNYKDIQSSYRSDAEHFHPKYDDILKTIFYYKLGYSNINNHFEKVITLSSKEKKEYPYIEIGDINISSGDYSYSLIKKNDLPTNAKIKAKQNDLLISKVRPYRGAVSIIYDNIEDLIVSSAFTVLREKSNYKKEVLLLLLRSLPYKELVMKWNVGTSYPVVRDSNLMNLPIPNVKDEIQKELKISVEKSFKLRRNSLRLIEVAKRAVEIAIERNEESALKYLRNEQSFLK